MYQKYNQLGLCVIPEKNGIPLFAWSEYMERLPTAEECASWKGNGYGLVCGKVSGVIALDIDTDDSAILDKVIALAGKSGLVKRGSKGRTLFYKYDGQPSRSWKQDSKVIVELLSDKRKTTIPPSNHRTTGKEYIWESENYIDIPLLGKGFIEMLDILFPSPKREMRAAEYTIEMESVSFDEVSELLDYCNPNMSYQDWVSIGMALRHEYGDAAFGLWDNWSSKGTSYDKRQMTIKWRSFNGDGYGIGTIIYFAQQGGWVKKYEPHVVDISEIDLSYLNPVTIEERRVFKAHGLVGMIAEWITETAYRPQPQLSLGAALTFVGMLKGHKFSTSSGLRTNFLAMNIAPTGGGKEHPQKCIRELMSACGLKQHRMARPTSGTGLLTGLQKANRVGLLTIDELGRYLGNISNKNSGGYQKEIVDYIIEMFSLANSDFSGRQYANEKQNPTIELIQPHLCVLGSSVREKITESCRSSDAIDGFLNRWILFESKETPPRNKEAGEIEIPANIISAVESISGGNPYPLQDNEKPVVKIVKYTPEAYNLMESYVDGIEELRNKSESVKKSLYVRSCEHVSKLALILCDNEFIRLQDVELAIEIVSESNKLIIDFTGFISDNDKEAEIIKTLEIIRQHKNINRSLLVQKTRFLGTTRRLNEVLASLSEEGSISVTQAGKSYIVSAL